MGLFDLNDRIAVLSFVFRYFPTQLDFVTGQLDALRAARLQLGVAGSLALIWGSLGVFGAVTSAVNEAWGVEKQRSFWKHRLVSFLMLVAAGSVMMLALLLVTFIQMAQATWFGSMLARFAWLTNLQSFAVRNLATMLLMFAATMTMGWKQINATGHRAVKEDRDDYRRPTSFREVNTSQLPAGDPGFASVTDSTTRTLDEVLAVPKSHS